MIYALRMWHEIEWCVVLSTTQQGNVIRKFLYSIFLYFRVFQVTRNPRCTATVQRSKNYISEEIRATRSLIYPQVVVAFVL